MPKPPATSVEAAEAAEAAAKAERKAARRLARLAAAGAAEAEEEVDADAARRLARKAAKKAAAAAAAPQDVEEQEPEQEQEDDEAARKAARKAARRAARAAAECAEEEQKPEASPEAAVPPCKRKDETSQEHSEEPTAKKRKAADGTSGALSAEAFRESHQIVVQAGCPQPFQSFAAAAQSFGPKLHKALLAQGYDSPTPIQAQAWPIALSGQDMVAVAKTGSGKTCGFLLPVLARIGERGPCHVPVRYSWTETEPSKPSVLVLAPTRELAQQIAGEAEKFSAAVQAKVITIYGGVPKGDQARELRGGCDVLIATPGRLLDFAAGQKDRGLAPSVSLESVTYLVLDEADRMLDMGFETDIRKIVGQCPATGKPEESGGAAGAATKRQTLFFTATWPKDVQATAASLTSQSAVQVRIGQGADGDKLTANKNVAQRIDVIEESQKRDRLEAILAKELKDGETCIVFASMKARCDDIEQDLQRKLGSSGLWCRGIHSGKDQWVRDESLAKFREITAAPNGKRAVLIATDVAARGLDIPGVALVVVYDFGRGTSAQNGGVESYVHRIGRTGRAGAKGRAVTFFTRADNGSVALVELLRGADQEVSGALEEIAASEADELWFKHHRKSFYSKGGSKGKGKGGGGKGKGKGKGKSGGGRGLSW